MAEATPAMVVTREECSGVFLPDGTHVSLGILTDNEAFIYICATRYALNRQTYAGGIVVGELLKALPRIPYNDRKVLEREIADALFRNEVDAIHRADWQAVVDAIRQQEGM